MTLNEIVACLLTPSENSTTASIESATELGLYAYHASPATWQKLGLGEPPDGRPLFVSKAENSLVFRTEGQFGKRALATNSPTGSSTLRRSLAAARGRGYRGIPRNPSNPEHFANYGLSPEQDNDLSEWIREHLRLAFWPHSGQVALAEIETEVLLRFEPPLNLRKVSTPWRGQVMAAREVLTGEARRWRAVR